MDKFKYIEKIGDGTYGTVLRSINSESSKYNVSILITIIIKLKSQLSLNFFKIN